LLLGAEAETADHCAKVVALNKKNVKNKKISLSALFFTFPRKKVFGNTADAGSWFR